MRVPLFLLIGPLLFLSVASGADEKEDKAKAKAPTTSIAQASPSR